MDSATGSLEICMGIVVELKSTALDVDRGKAKTASPDSDTMLEELGDRVISSVAESIPLVA